VTALLAFAQGVALALGVLAVAWALAAGWARAIRRGGELIQAQRETVGLNRGAKGSKVTGSKRDPLKDDRPTLAEAGIDKRLADRARKYAAIPEAEFERELRRG